MANTTNKGAASKQEAAQKDEVKELKEMLAQKDKETDELKDMIKQLSEIVKMTQAANQQSSNKDDIDDIADLVYITNNSIGKQIISTDRLGQNSIVIKPAEKNRPIERDYIKQAMNIVQMRRLFEYGILEFEDERYYKIYGITRKFDMSEKNVLDMFSVEKISKTASQLIEMFKKDDASALQHELCYKALDLISKGELPMEETNTINVTLNKIFCSKVTVSFNDLLANLPLKRGEV